MTAIDLPIIDVAPAEPRAISRTVSSLRNVAVMTRRNLVHIAREPMQLSDVTVQPVLFTVLFVYVFGSGMSIPGGGSYTDFVMAGLLTMNLVTSSMGTGVGLATDLSTGMIERFRTLPMWRSSVLVGRTVSDLLSAAVCSVIVCLTGLAVGWRTDSSMWSVLAGFGVALFFAYALDLADRLPGPPGQRARVGNVHRLRDHFPARVRLRCSCTHAPHAELAASHCRLEPC